MSERTDRCIVRYLSQRCVAYTYGPMLGDITAAVYLSTVLYADGEVATITEIVAVPWAPGPTGAIMQPGGGVRR